jgi:hypothetical protein
MGNARVHIVRMDLAASSATHAVCSADALPFSRRSDGSPAPKRSRAKLLTKVDRRSQLGKRIVELTQMFSAAIGGELTPMRRLAVDKAAQLTAIAEQARGAFMRDGVGTLDDIVRLERKADQAVRALGTIEAKPKAPSLLARMAEGERFDWRPGERVEGAAKAATTAPGPFHPAGLVSAGVGLTEMAASEPLSPGNRAPSGGRA